MSYVELIVVLSIFAIMSAIVSFNYGAFQAKVDIKSLASDIALKIVEAQKSSLSGLQSTSFAGSLKPSFGVYFDTSTSNQFIYFADLNNNNAFDPITETLQTIAIPKNDTISKIESCVGARVVCTQLPSPLAITFSRPSSNAVLYSGGVILAGVSYVQITIVAPNGTSSALIKIYPSGRIQVN
ncbi:MAG: type II secretion system protein [Patescibacteria group bacterium]|nr:type II secretion system protein [Patescibacteria group bacterium]